jgi:hypothetical protein
MQQNYQHQTGIHYPAADFTAHLHGCIAFSKVDLMKGYHQATVAAVDVTKTLQSAPQL